MDKNIVRRDIWYLLFMLVASFGVLLTILDKTPGPDSGLTVAGLSLAIASFVAMTARVYVESKGEKWSLEERKQLAQDNTRLSAFTLLSTLPLLLLGTVGVRTVIPPWLGCLAFIGWALFTTWLYRLRKRMEA